MERRSKARVETGAFVFIVATALVFLNLLAVKVLHVRFDLTKRELYTLSRGTRNTLSRLTDNVTVTVYWTPDQPAPANDDERLLREQLQEYVALGRGHVELRWVPTSDDDTRRQADSAQCAKRPLQVVNTQSESAQLVEVYRCITFSYLRNTERIEFVNPGIEGMEYQITSIVKKMIDPERAIGFLTGHSEASPEQAMPYLSQFLQQQHLGYTTQTVDLHGGDEDIPSSVKGLIIVNPTTRIEEKELRRINAYLMRGGSVAIFSGGLNITGNDTTPTANRAEHNLNALLNGYGLTLNSDVVLDYQGSDSVQEIQMGRVRIPMFAYPALAARRDDDGPGIDNSHPAVFRLPGINLPFVSTISVDATKLRRESRGGHQVELLGGAAFTRLARTSARSIVQRDNYSLEAIDLIQRRNAVFANPTGNQLVGVVLEGELRSAFGPPPADANAPAATPVPDHAAAGHPARLLVMGSGKTFNIEQLRAIAPLQGGVPFNVQMLLNTFDWLSQDSDLLAVRAKDVSEPNLGEVSDVKKNIFKWGSIFGLPLLVGVLGVVLMSMRARARAEIKL